MSLWNTKEIDYLHFGRYNMHMVLFDMTDFRVVFKHHSSLLICGAPSAPCPYYSWEGTDWCRWGCLVTLTVPGLGAVLWWGAIPVGSPQGSVADKAVFVFIVHPIASAFLSFLLCSMFLIGMDQSMPWRPLHVFLPTVSAVYITQARSMICMNLSISAYNFRSSYWLHQSSEV